MVGLLSGWLGCTGNLKLLLSAAAVLQSHLACGEFEGMATLKTSRKSLEEGGDGFTQVCLFERMLAVVIQEVPGSNE